MPRRAKKRQGALYHGLPPGTHGIDPGEVRRHQRARLHGAMVAAVASDGYAATTVATVVALAGVSRTTFYQHFTSKEDCFLQAHDLIVAFGVERVARAYRSASGLRERLRAAFAEFIEIVSTEPEAARLVIIEALAAGDVALEHRERAVDAYQRLLRQSFAGTEGEISDVTLRAIVGGVQRIVYIHLREQRMEDLPGLVDELVSWTLSYHDSAVKPPRPLRIRHTAPPTAPAFQVPVPSPADARLHLNQRERILLAVSSLVAEQGYPPLTVPVISARAGISNQTFYEHFADKQAAFLAAFDDAEADALAAVAATHQAAATVPDALREVVRTLLTYTAQHPVFARLAFFEPLTPGAAGQDHAERQLQSYITLLSPGWRRPPDVPSIAEQAIAGGFIGVIQGEIAHGRLKRLPRLTACLAFIALAPFIGAGAAAEIAQAA